jgi:hypothetical protein
MSKERVQLFVAARQRGWTLEQIGFAAGVTRERVRQVLAKYAYVPHRINLAKRPKITYSRTCLHCKKVEWVELSASKQKFCSKKCHAVHTRKTTYAGILEVIDLRLKHHTWSDIQRTTGRSYQAHVMNTWWLLYDYRLLVIDIINKLYSKRCIEFQIRATGLVPERAFIADNWFEELKRRVIADGEERVLPRKFTVYERKKWAGKKYVSENPRGPNKTFTDEELLYLKTNFRIKSSNEIARHLNRDPSIISRAALQLKLRGLGREPRRGLRYESKVWTAEDIKYLRNHVMTDGTAAVGIALDKLTREVRRKAKSIGLDPPKWKYTNDSYHYKNKRPNSTQQLTRALVTE